MQPIVPQQKRRGEFPRKKKKSPSTFISHDVVNKDRPNDIVSYHMKDYT